MNGKLRRTIALAALAVTLWILISGCYADSTTSSGTTSTTGSATGSAPPPAATPTSTDTAATPAARDTSGGNH